MKVAVIYSTRTGNTKVVAEAIASAVDGTLFDVKRMPEDIWEHISEYDVVFIGFWARKRGADEGAQQAIVAMHGKKVGLFGTGGVYPDSEKAKEYLANAAALLPDDATYLGGLMRQGKVHSFHMRKLAGESGANHGMEPERIARLEEAEKHPNEEDFRIAHEWAKGIMAGIE